MGAGTSRLQLVVAPIDKLNESVLNKFTTQAPGDRSIQGYFDDFVRPQLPSHDGYVLKKAFICLKGEKNLIETEGLQEGCSQYLDNFEVIKAVFAVQVPQVQAAADADPSGGDSEGGGGSDDDEQRNFFDDECEDQEVAEVEVVQETGPSAKKQKKPADLNQASLGKFFGKGVVTKFGRTETGEKVIASSTLLELPDTVAKSAVLSNIRHCRYCHKSFSHAPAHVHHEKTCSLIGYRAIAHTFDSDEEEPAVLGPEGDGEQVGVALADVGGSSEQDAQRAAGSQDGERDGGGELEQAPAATSATAVPSGEEGEESVSTGGAAPAAAPTAAPRLRKMLRDGSGFKHTGLRPGQKRGANRSIFFKYEVVCHYRQMQELKEKGRCATPGQATADRFSVTPGQVSTWAKMESMLKEALLACHHSARRGPKSSTARGEELVAFRSAAARRFTLHPGRRRKFAAAEAEVHKIYKEKRAKGHRIRGTYLRLLMKREVRRIYGDEAADQFKASKAWLVKFTSHYNMSLRRSTNKKNMSVEERASKCKRWHARFRRRLQRGKQLDPKWGRWLPVDRISVDQVRT